MSLQGTANTDTSAGGGQDALDLSTLGLIMMISPGHMTVLLVHALAVHCTAVIMADQPFMTSLGAGCR